MARKQTKVTAGPLAAASETVSEWHEGLSVAGLEGPIGVEVTIRVALDDLTYFSEVENLLEQGRDIGVAEITRIERLKRG